MKTNFTYRLYAYSMHKSRTAHALFSVFIFLIGLNGWGQEVSTYMPLITSGTYSAITGTTTTADVRNFRDRTTGSKHWLIFK